jgi:hypothetical protein
MFLTLLSRRSPPVKRKAARRVLPVWHHSFNKRLDLCWNQANLHLHSVNSQVSFGSAPLGTSFATAPLNTSFTGPSFATPRGKGFNPLTTPSSFVSALSSPTASGNFRDASTTVPSSRTLPKQHGHYGAQQRDHSKCTTRFPCRNHFRR